MKLTIHRGTHEVGGNCVEVNSGTTRIILDVGLPLFEADRRQLDTSALRGHSVDELLRAGIAAKMSPFRIELDELRANPSRYVMVFRPSMLASDFDNELPPRSRCLYSS